METCRNEEKNTKLMNNEWKCIKVTMIKVSSLKPGALYFFSKSQRNCFGDIICILCYTGRHRKRTVGLIAQTIKNCVKIFFLKSFLPSINIQHTSNLHI